MFVIQESEFFKIGFSNFYISKQLIFKNMSDTERSEIWGHRCRKKRFSNYERYKEKILYV